MSGLYGLLWFDLYPKEQLQEFCDFVFRDNEAVYQSLMMKYRRDNNTIRFV